MAQPSKAVFISFPAGELVSLPLVHGMRHLQDGRVLLAAADNSPLIVFDPEDFDGVGRDEVIQEFRRVLLAYSESKPLELPVWMKL